MATTQIYTNHYGITNLPSVNTTGIDFSAIESYGFQYTGTDNDGAYCFVGLRGAIRCLFNVYNNGEYQVRDQNKNYNVHVGGTQRFIIANNKMIRKPLLR